MNFAALIKDHPTLVVAIVIGAVNLVGLFYNYAVFAALGHSYTDFAAFEDFLVSAFKSPLALVYSALFFLSVSWTIGSFKKAFHATSNALFRRFLALSAFCICAFGVAVVPAMVGWMSVLSSKDDLFIFPATPEVAVTCKRTGTDIVTYEGELISEAGKMFLLKTEQEIGLLVSKECVTSIGPRL